MIKYASVAWVDQEKLKITLSLQNEPLLFSKLRLTATLTISATTRGSWQIKSQSEWNSGHFEEWADVR